MLDCFLAGLLDGCCPSCEGSKRVKLFLERIHASLLIQLSHSDDSLIPYVGSCIYRKEFGVHIARKLGTRLVAWMGCSSATLRAVHRGQWWSGGR